MSTSEKTERKPYNPYPLGVWNVEGISPTAQAVLGCLGAHSNYLGETLLGIERKDDKGAIIGGLVKKTKLSKRAVYDGLEEIYTKGRVSRDDRRGGKWGRNSSRTKIWLTAEELTKAGAEDLSLYPVKTHEEIAAKAESNKAAAAVRSAKMRAAKVARASGSAHKQSKSTCNKDTESQSYGAGGAQLMVQQAQSHGAPRLHEPSVTLPSLGDLQESSKPTASPKPETRSLCSPKKEGKKTQDALSGDPQLVKDAAVRPTLRVTLKPEVVAKLRAYGCPPPVLDKLELYTKMASILNGNGSGKSCSNPVTAYATFAKRNPEFAKLWMPKQKSETLNGDDGDFLEEMMISELAKARQTPEQAQREDAMYWWAGKTLEQRKAYPVRHTEKEMFGEMVGSYDEGEMVKAYLHEMETGNSYEAKQWRKQKGIAVGA
jgi:hypothetical protein